MAEQNLASAYAGEKGEAYFKGRGQDNLMHLGYRLQARFYRPHLTKDMTVLDFGCGNGSMAALLREDVAEVDGLEVNDMPRALARDSFDLTVYDGLDSIPEDRKYDAIVSNHVFEHIPHPIAMLRDLHKILKPSGKVIIMVPVEDFRTARNADWRSPDVNQHLHTWTPLQFAHTLREAGFEPQEVRTITSAWTHKAFFLGDGALQGLFMNLFSRLKKRRQLLAVAKSTEGAQ